MKKISSTLIPLVHPYKIERGKRSFQCGKSKNCLRVHEFPWSKKCTHNIQYFLNCKIILDDDIIHVQSRAFGSIPPSKGGRHLNSSLHSSNNQIVKNNFFINENENKVKLSTKYNLKKFKIINYHQKKHWPIPKWLDIFDI